MRVSFLTTYRHSDKYRLVNLERVISHISTECPGWEIIVIEQDEESTLGTHPLVEKVIYTHVYNPGPFNKSWGMNVAFKKSSGEVLVICDADMIMQAVDLRRAVAACEKELDAVRPYGRLIDMTEDETENYMQYYELPGAPEKERGYDRAHASEVLCMAGGIYIVRQELYKRAGGMDERFSGWGGEDDAMSIKLQGLSMKVAIAKNAKAWHLWHPRGDCYSHDGYQGNRQLFQKYKLMSKVELSELCHQQLKNIGNEEKYCE